LGDTGGVKRYSMLTSRFFTTNDEKVDTFVYPIPVEWWSRGYEYPWAGRLAESDHVVLDAGCGIGHHFKFALAGVCKQVHACDVDQNIINEPFIIKTIKNGFNFDVTELCGNIYYKICDIGNLDYPNHSFDRVFCISVLEHCSASKYLSILKEFKRILKEDGLIVLTFDFPTHNLLGLLPQLIKETGLTFAGKFNNQKPENAIYSQGLNVFRAVLKYEL
jgi:ubiquinone/menaquinone biosynthesis C-methylase UbiE